MALIDTLLRAAPVFNRGMVALLDVPLVGPLISRGLAVVTYTGRRSGRTFSTPVGYRRRGDELLIAVVAPDHKRWWRNFLGDGAPISVRLAGAQRPGHAVATRDATGRVEVAVSLASD